jgi:pimeloyl-ACP methyl ester carboxylesterase
VGPPMVNNEVLRQGPDGSMAKAKEDETHDSRRRYFSRVYDESVAAGTPASILVPQAQPYFWYRDDWEPCKRNHIAASRSVRQEIYNADFRRWHWRVAAEQVIYSHIDRLDHHHDNNPQNTNPYRYELNMVRQLLVAGQKDDDPGLHIYTSMRDLAAKMNTPGTSLFLLNTGHSIHFERPKFLAGKIVDFLPGPKRADISFLTPLLLSDPVSKRTDISFLTPLLLSGGG